MNIIYQAQRIISLQWVQVGCEQEVKNITTAMGWNIDQILKT